MNISDVNKYKRDLLKRFTDKTECVLDELLYAILNNFWSNLIYYQYFFCLEELFTEDGSLNIILIVIQ